MMGPPSQGKPESAVFRQASGPPESGSYTYPIRLGSQRESLGT